MFFKKLMRLPHISYIAGKRFFVEAYTYRASALAFTTVLAVVPLLFVVVFFMTIFPFFATFIMIGEKYILENFVPTSALALEYYFQGFIHQAMQLPGISMLFLIFTTVMLVHTIEETLNDIWQVPRRKRGKKVLALFFYWLLFLLIPIMIGLSVFLTSYILILSWMGSPSTHEQISIYFIPLLPLIINTLIFSLLYTLVPNSNVKFRDGLLGGFIAALLFECAKLAFAYYLKQFPSYALIYGAFAAIPIFLIWLYIFWFIILFGALFVHAKNKKN